MNTRTIASFSLAAAAVLAITGFATNAEASDRIRHRCKASGDVDISMGAKNEIRSNRRKFSTEFEAGPTTSFKAGDRLNIEVKGVVVGSVVLDAIIGGDVVGDLNFDTRPQPPDSIAFPTNWPNNVGRDTEVRVLKGTSLVLGCTLR